MAKLAIEKKKCIACGGCVAVCPFNALELEAGREIKIDHEKCTRCGICTRFCPVGALAMGDKK